MICVGIMFRMLPEMLHRRLSGTPHTSSPRLLAVAVFLLLGFSSHKANADTSQPWTMYLNRCKTGCTVEPGANNARKPYRSSIPAQTSTIPEFQQGDAIWDAVVECVQDVYAPYNVVVTDVEPPPTSQYHMAIVAGVAADIGRNPNIGGLGLAGCDPIDNAISFTFDVWGNNPDLICGVIAQETAHTFGLDHEFNCASPMTYLPYCGRTFFRDRNFTCGENSPRDSCRCSGPAQNSHRWLLGKLGANPVPPPGPDVAINSPTANEMVNDGFMVNVMADDRRTIDRVEFWANGTKMSEVKGPELGQSRTLWSWATDASLAGGIIDIDVKAYNDIQVETVKTVTVQKGPPCTTEATCSTGQFCEDGRCKFPIATGDIGDTCSAGSDCISGLCPLDGNSGFCSKDCDPNSLLTECPDGFECRDGGASGFCWPESSGGCGCSTGSHDGAPLGTLLIFIGVCYALRRKRTAN